MFSDLKVDGVVLIGYNVCMDTMTINISMPRGLYAQAKRRAKRYHYNSVSEVIRDALRWWLNDKLTRNGFTPEFEEEVLRSAAEPRENDIEWSGKESDLPKHVKGGKNIKVLANVGRHAGGKSGVGGRNKFTGVAI